MTLYRRQGSRPSPWKRNAKKQNGCLGRTYRLGWACVLCPSQVRAAQVTKCLVSTLPRCAVRLIASPVPAAWFPGCTAGAPSQVCCVSPLGSWSLATTLLVDVNCPASQENLVSNWEPAHSLVEDVVSGAEIAPFQLWWPPTCLSTSSRAWASPQPASSPLVFTQSFVLWVGPAVP